MLCILLGKIPFLNLVIPDLYFNLPKHFSDAFNLPQVVVVQAISALCQKYPRKHSVMMNFLSNMLRDDVS